MKKNVWLMNHYATRMYENLGGRHYWFAENLQKNGYNPVIFCASTFHNSDKQIDLQGKKYIEKTTETGIKFVFVKAPPYKGNGFSRVKNMISFAWNLYFVAKNYAKKHENPDVILASSVHPLTIVAGIFLGRYFKVPCIGEVRDLWPESIFVFGKAKADSLIGKMLLAGEHWIYKNAQALIFAKEGDTEYLKEQNWTTNQNGDVDLKKCHYINNGIDIKAFDENQKNSVLEDFDLLDGNYQNVIYTGTIRPVNNIENILDAAKVIYSKKSNVRFLIYGDGSNLENLKRIVVTEHIDNVKFKGYVNKKFIPYILSKSFVNLLNYSQNEFNWSRGNSSNKLFEYMASGKPIISNIKVGYSNIIKYNCGIELEQNTPEALANAIISFCDMSAEEYTEYCDRARSGAYDFDFATHTQKLIQIIESISK